MAERPIPGKEVAAETHRTISLEDAELVERVRAGQTEAYGKLVLKYQDRVFNACWRICGHLEDARDLTQEAFLRAYERLDHFRHESGFYTWLFRVAVNLALTHRRGAKRRRTTSLYDDGPSGTQADALGPRAGGATEGTRPAGEREGNAALHDELVRAMQTLDDEHRAVVVLRDVEGFDYQQIGEMLEIPTGTVKSRLHRARMALRESLAPWLTSQRRNA